MSAMIGSIDTPIPSGLDSQLIANYPECWIFSAFVHSVNDQLVIAVRKGGV
jgi:hypothetical protein